MAQCKATAKSTGKRCRRHAVDGYEVCQVHGAGGGAPKGNKNAVKTGEYESIYLQALTEEEAALFASVRTGALQVVEEEIRLTKVRIQRMLQRITGTEADDLANLEDAITRVQGRLIQLAEIKRQLEAEDGEEGLDDHMQRFLERLTESRKRAA